MSRLKLFGQLFVFFLSTQTSHTKIYDKNLLRIVGGQSVSYDKYPYVARLELITLIEKETHRSHLCTCSVLTPIWTLSASHCSLIFNTLPNATLIVTYGSTLPLGKEVKHSKVLKIFTHPAFKWLGDLQNIQSLKNDIALLKTDPVILPQYGRVSSMDYMSLVGFTAIVFGFGVTNYTKLNEMFFATTLPLNKPLQTLNVLIKRCSNDVLDSVKIYPGLCLARKCGETVSICSGDSGGPLVHNSQIIGVNSIAANRDCSNRINDGLKTHVVGIITAASPFSEWIGNVINENGGISAQPKGKRA